MSAPGTAERDPSVAIRRAIAMGAIAVVAFSVIAIRLYMLQIQEGDAFLDKSKSNFFQTRRLEHERGEIVDRYGRVLVTNRPSVNVYVTPAFFPDAKKNVLRLASVSGLSREEGEVISVALSKAVKEDGPAILVAKGLSRRRARRVRRVAESLELDLDAIPIIEVPRDPPEFAVYIDPDHFPSRGLVMRRLRDAMNLDEDAMKALERRIRRTRGLDKYRGILVRRDVSLGVEGQIGLLVQLGELPGVTVESAKARHYEHGELAAHVLGYVNELSPTELEERRDQGYRLGDSIGRRGIENTFEEELRGTDGRETIVVDSKGRAQQSKFARRLDEEVGVHVEPTPGNRVVLTMDLGLQQAAEDAFNGRAGAIVALEAQTGRILAMTSTPSFDPNLLAGYFDPKEKRRLDEMRELRPWRFRAIQDYFAPGSTFKVVTALAALKAGVTNEREQIRCPGAYRLGRTRFRCWKESGHGMIDLHKSFARSCDVYYYTLGARLGLDPIAEMGRALSFGEMTGVQLAAESRGIMPDANWYRKHLPEGYTLGAAVNASIGQGAVSVTPLQLAVSYAAIANGGTVYRPQVALRIESYDGKAVRPIPPEALRQLELPPGALAGVREGLRQVVNEPFGTAYRKRLKDVQVSGKTGTAQVAKLGKVRIRASKLPWKVRDHAWFGAFAPSDDPEVVVVVLVEHGGGGSSAAAPIAMRVIQAWHDMNQQRASLPSSPVRVATIDPEHPWHAAH